jgi:transposase-like protein
MTDTIRTNRKYTKEEKEKFLSRMLPLENYSISKLSEETGISKSTLSIWKTKSLSGTAHKKQGRPSKRLSPGEKFLVAMETYTMSELEISKYCRENGFYVEDVKVWRASYIAANELQKEDSKELREELNKEKKKCKVLEKEIRIKDKALAETTALLVLKKSYI